MRLSDLTILNLTSFLKSQAYLQPVMMLFYMENGLTVADFFFYQGIVCFAELLLGLPCGWLADRFQKKYMLILAYSMLLLRYSLWFFLRGWLVILIGELCYAFYKSLFQSSAEGYIYQYLCDHQLEKKNLHNYGKFNSAMSSGSAVAALLGALLFKEVGISLVLIVQIAIIALSILLLIFIAPVNRAVKEKDSAREMFSFRLLAVELKNSSLKYYILLSALLTSITALLVNSFQPLMILGSVPVILYGFVYFLNHITRAISSFYASKVIRYLGITKLGIVILVILFPVFASIFMIAQNNVNAVEVLSLLVLACIGIAFILALNVGIVSILQEKTKIDNRSMMASVNNTTTRLFSSVLLFVNTWLVKNGSLTYEALLGCFVLSVCVFLIFRLIGKSEN